MPCFLSRFSSGLRYGKRSNHHLAFGNQYRVSFRFFITICALAVFSSMSLFDGFVRTKLPGNVGDTIASVIVLIEFPIDHRPAGAWYF